MKKLSLVVVLLILGAGNAFACRSPLPGEYDTFEELVDLTNQIVLATFWCEESNGLSCGFDVVETIKGPSRESVTPRHWLQHALNAVQEDTVGDPNDFDSHSDPKFWKQELGRSEWLGGMCVPSFSFIPNEQYLIFLDSPANPYAAELIRQSDDVWLNWVREHVENAHNQAMQFAPAVPDRRTAGR